MSGIVPLGLTVNGPGSLALIFGAGLISFLSPCTLPLLPGYLSYMSGVGVDDVQSGRNSRVLFTGAVLFVLGFSLIFVSEGATASYIGAALQPHRDILTRIAGAFIILMALAMIGLIPAPFLYQERRFHPSAEFGLWSSFPLGMAFAFGWTPCIGPTLSSVLTYAGTTGSAQQGAFLLFIYALGLGLPFLLVALFAGRLLGSLAPIKRHFVAINRVGGAILLVMGIFLLLDSWTQLLSPVLTWYAQFNLPS